MDEVEERYVLALSQLLNDLVYYVLLHMPTPFRLSGGMCTSKVHYNNIQQKALTLYKKFIPEQMFNKKD